VDVELTPEGRVQIAGTRQLAGSGLRMDRGVANLVAFAGLTLAQALRMATVNPARALRLAGRTGFLEPGDASDLILFRWDPARPRVSVEEVICSPLAV
jgi:N-acetylglucosamine-6-phosphate deacetylase